MLGWANALWGGYPENANTYSYGNYANLQMAQMAQQQQTQANPGHYWETPSQREYDRRKRQELEELTKRGWPDGFQPAKMSERLDDPPDPFRQLCNHDFHALLDKFRKMGVA
jgi:flagellar biosynthesis/type III secretory pathway protein FliH